MDSITHIYIYTCIYMSVIRLTLEACIPPPNRTATPMQSTKLTQHPCCNCCSGTSSQTRHMLRKANKVREQQKTRSAAGRRPSFTCALALGNMGKGPWANWAIHPWPCLRSTGASKGSDRALGPRANNSNLHTDWNKKVAQPSVYSFWHNFLYWVGLGQSLRRRTQF